MRFQIIFLWLLISLININRSKANTYYVSVNGDDTQAGTVSQPWKSIQKAANTLVAGDTVYIRAGNYILTERIEPAASGSASHYIHYLAYPGEEHLVVIDGSQIPAANWFGIFYISAKSYLKFSGLRLENAGFAGFLIEDSAYIELQNNRTFQTYSSGISVWNSHHIIINNNEISRACWPTGGVQECVSISGSQYVEVKNNHVFDGGSIGYGGGGEGIDIKDGCHNVIVHHNWVEGIASVGIYVDAYAHNQSDVQVYQNKIENIAGVGISVASEEGGELQNVLVQRNTIAHCSDRAMVIHWTQKPDYVIQNIYVQHNTFVGNQEGLDIGAHALGSNIHIVNNIFSQNGLYQMQNSSNDLPANALHIRHNLLDGDNPSWALFGDNYVLDSPQFVDAAANNFYLTNNSPAINQGAFLTQTINAGSGNMLTVVDARFFSDAYGLTSGDEIRLEGETQNRQIVAVDIVQNTLTLAENIVWQDATAVSQAYLGIAPDIGAYEFDPAAAVKTEKLPQIMVYPNPATTYLKVLNAKSNQSYQIYNLRGQLLQTGNLEAGIIPVSALIPGVYFLKVLDIENGTDMIFRWIKK